MTNHNHLNSTPDCNDIILCNDPSHTSLTCYYRYFMLEYEGNTGGIMDYTTWRALASTRR